jgi:long-chain acyl-CoA synthetase
VESLEGRTLLGSLFECASKHPAKVALRSGGESLTYERYMARILSTAARLRALGVAEASRVLVSSPNSLHIPILYFAIHALGAIAVPIAPDTAGLAVVALANDCGATLAVLGRAPAGMPCPVTTPPEMTAPGTGSVAPVCRRGSIADILYTTGTTGKKKGAVLTQENVFAAARNMTEFIGTTGEDVEVLPLPLSHSFGIGRLRSLALAGHTLAIERGVGNGGPVIKSLLSLRATGLAMVPAGFDILHRVTGDALGQARDRLRYVEIGSAPLRPQTRAWLLDMLPKTRICHHYGLTEASRAAFTECHADPGRTGVGKASPNVSIAICDENLNRLGPRQSGEIVVQGDVVMREYWKQPELTRDALCAWGLRTGDIGYLDEEGYLTLIGRKCDLINVGGRKVIPDEVEEELRLIEGVRDAVCVGETDPLLGEHVKAFVVANHSLDLAAITAFLQPRLEGYKIPRALELTASVPRTGSGKPQRQLLRARPAAESAA